MLNLSDCKWTQTNNHLVRKRTPNQLAKLFSLDEWLTVRFRVVVGRVPLQSLKFPDEYILLNSNI